MEFLLFLIVCESKKLIYLKVLLKSCKLKVKTIDIPACYLFSLLLFTFFYFRFVEELNITWPKITTTIESSGIKPDWTFGHFVHWLSFPAISKQQPTMHPYRNKRVPIISIDITDLKEPYEHLIRFLCEPFSSIKILIKRYIFVSLLIWGSR